MQNTVEGAIMPPPWIRLKQYWKCIGHIHKVGALWFLNFSDKLKFWHQKVLNGYKYNYAIFVFMVMSKYRSEPVNTPPPHTHTPLPFSHKRHTLEGYIDVHAQDL